MYSERLLDHFQNPRNVGTLEAPAVTVRVENPVCGDILTVSALVEHDVVVRVAFQVKGCTASIAAGSALTELIAAGPAGLIPSAAEVEQALDGLPNESKHAARLAEDAAKALAEKLSC